ncbi:DUF4405 domain-containing protein [Pirellulaceae bacterium SH449]
MKRTTVNLTIDLLAAAFFLGVVATGYILYFPLPPGANKSLYLWGLTRHEWGRFHFWMSVGLLAVLVVHLALHWHWVAATVGQRFGLARNPQSQHVRSGAITAVVVIMTLALFAWIAEISVRDRSDPPYSTAPSGETTATESKRETLGAEVTSAGIDFWRDVHPILEASCVRCHGPSRGYGDFRIDRREDFFGQDGGPALVIPGKSAESPLIAIVRGQRPNMRMAAAHKLSDRQADVLQGWIDAGAKWPQKIVDR